MSLCINLQALDVEKDGLVGRLIRLTFELAVRAGDEHPACPACTATAT